MYMVITDFFLSIVEFSTGRYICICNGCDPPPRQFHIVHDFPLYTLNPLLPWILQISNLEREKEVFFNEKVVLKYLNTSLCCKIIITF